MMTFDRWTTLNLLLFLYFLTLLYFVPLWYFLCLCFNIELHRRWRTTDPSYFRSRTATIHFWLLYRFLVISSRAINVEVCLVHSYIYHCYFLYRTILFLDYIQIYRSSCCGWTLDLNIGRSSL